MTWMLRMESPPSSKKLSWIPTRSSRNTCDQISASFASIAVRGSVNCVPNSGRSCSGSGKALRSILPLLVSGSLSRNTIVEGTM